MVPTEGGKSSKNSGTDVMGQFLGSETDIMGERYFMNLSLTLSFCLYLLYDNNVLIKRSTHKFRLATLKCEDPDEQFSLARVAERKGSLCYKG